MITTAHDRAPSIADRRAHRLRWVGLAFAAAPLAVFTLFAVGEGVAGEPGWWSHLLQVVAVGALAGVAWRRPAVGGPLLVLVGLAFSVLAVVAINDDLLSRLVVVGVFLAPLVVAGALFGLAGRGRPRGGTR